MTDLTIFVAFGNPADAGLDGTLSVCILPETGDWVDVSIMQKLEKKYNFTTIFVSFNFVEVSDIHFGTITFTDASDFEAKDLSEDMTFGGQIVL